MELYMKWRILSCHDLSISLQVFDYAALAKIRRIENLACFYLFTLVGRAEIIE